MTTQNPYPPQSNEYARWELEQRGFNQAQINLILNGDQTERSESGGKEPDETPKKLVLQV